jgi:hypothetical protein
MTSRFAEMGVIFALCLQLNSCVTDPHQQDNRTVSQVQHSKTWVLPFGWNSVGSTLDQEFYELKVVIQGNVIFFVDLVLSRINSIDVISGAVKWGERGSLHLAGSILGEQLQVNDIAFFSSHLFLLSGSGVLIVDSSLSIYRTELFQRTVGPGAVWDSVSGTNLVGLLRWHEFADTGTGSKYYAKYLRFDRALNLSEETVFLGETAHLDAQNPPREDSLWRRSHNHLCGKPFAIRIIGADTCLDTGSRLLRIPPQYSREVMQGFRFMDFDNDRLAIWNIDEAQKVYIIALFDYRSD